MMRAFLLSMVSRSLGRSFLFLEWDQGAETLRFWSKDPSLWYWGVPVEELGDQTEIEAYIGVHCCKVPEQILRLGVKFELLLEKSEKGSVCSQQAGRLTMVLFDAEHSCRWQFLEAFGAKPEVSLSHIVHEWVAEVGES